MTNKEIIEKKQEYINKLKAEKKELKDQYDFLRKQHREDTHTISDQEKGRDQLIAAMNAYFKEACIKYGESVKEGDEILGYRMILPLPSIKNVEYLTCKIDNEKREAVIAYLPKRKK